MAVIAVCTTCGREFPLPQSGRGRCLHCVAQERHSFAGSATALAPTVRERRARHEHRTSSDRRFPEVILVDRRILGVARPWLFDDRAGPLDRRQSTDRRQSRRRFVDAFAKL